MNEPIEEILINNPRSKTTKTIKEGIIDFSNKELPDETEETIPITKPSPNPIIKHEKKKSGIFTNKLLNLKDKLNFVLNYCSNNEFYNLELVNKEMRDRILGYYEKLLGNTEITKTKKQKIPAFKKAFYERYNSKVKVFSYNKISSFYNLITKTFSSGDESARQNLNNNKDIVENICSCLVDSSKLKHLNSEIFGGLDYSYFHLKEYFDNDNMKKRYEDLNIESTIRYCQILQISCVENRMFILYKENELKVFCKSILNQDDYQLESHIILKSEEEEKLDIERLVFCPENDIIFFISTQKIYMLIYTGSCKSVNVPETSSYLEQIKKQDEKVYDKMTQKIFKEEKGKKRNLKGNTKNKEHLPVSKNYKINELTIKSLDIFVENEKITNITKLFYIKNYILIYSSTKISFYCIKIESLEKFVKKKLIEKNESLLTNSELQQIKLKEIIEKNSQNKEVEEEEKNAFEDEDEYEVLRKNLEKNENNLKENNVVKEILEKDNFNSLSFYSLLKQGYSNPVEFSLNQNSLMFLDDQNNVIF